MTTTQIAQVIDETRWRALQNANGLGGYTGANFLSTFIGNLLPYAISFAGILLLLMLIMGGYDILMGPANPQSHERGKNRITWAIAGFVVVFGTYWIVQLLELIFGIVIL